MSQTNYLWVKYKTFRAIKVATMQGQDVDSFIKACQMELQIPNPPQDISLSTTDGGDALDGWLLLTDIPGYSDISGPHPLFISLNDT
jgi:hypothetical protein